jgi:hypothetical protein
MESHLEISRDASAPGTTEVLTLTDGRRAVANIADAAATLDIGRGRTIHLFGDVFYHWLDGGDIRATDTGDEDYLAGLFARTPLEALIPRLEGQYVGLLVDPAAGEISVFCDRYSRWTVFYAQEGDALLLSTSLDFIFSKVRPRHDQLMLAHLFEVYGAYTPRGHTIYENVWEMRVGEILTVSAQGLSSKSIDFTPMSIEEYGEAELERYFTCISESVATRAAKEGTTWVSSSSGWDSSMMLGMLVHLVGPEKVGMITGSMQYSDDTDVINQFEIDKIRKIGSFYGITPEVVDFDFKSPAAADYWTTWLPHFRAHHVYAYSTFNFARLADGLTSAAGPGQTIINGETSDSFHNFGFSQFVTFFHTQKAFTEYADKMNCYLYGPHFLAKALDGSHERDKVFQIFERMNPGVEFASGFASKEDMLESYLMPFFYGGPRIPFAKTTENATLTSAARQAIYRFPYREYMPEVLGSFGPQNAYSWYIHLYHSFHSQGSTVNLHKYSMTRNGHDWRSPFNDYRLIELLSKAPQSWGRGLELNNTKFPLKWVAKNKIRFPYETLEEGPHSYLYDVMEGFSLLAEITYRSGVTGFFRETLTSKPYRRIMSDSHFDLAYLDGLVDDFLAGREAKGADFNNLSSLIALCVTGWYE